MIENTTILDTLTGLVVFTLGGREYCADIKTISAIINPNELKEDVDLKSDKPFVKINELRIPLIDLYSYFKLEPAGNEEDQRILLVDPEGKVFGFLVDRVREIFSMSRDFREKLEYAPLSKEPYLTGVLSYEGRSLYLPDFNSILFDTGIS